jgi:heme/copper-type cytochrome/quinol oxidase subunit 4
VNARKLVFGLLLLNLMIGLLGFAQMLSSGVTGWLTMIAFLQILSSFCVVCLSYWVATDKDKV